MSDEKFYKNCWYALKNALFNSEIVSTKDTRRLLDLMTGIEIIQSGIKHIDYDVTERE